MHQYYIYTFHLSIPVLFYSGSGMLADCTACAGAGAWSTSSLPRSDMIGHVPII
jgi:hypothetical protein